MSIKRYEPIQVVGPNGDDVAMEQRPDGEYYSRADIISSGALVPVPVELSEWYMTPAGLGWWGENEHGIPCVETPEGYHDAADCYPVRLVPIAEWEIEG